MRRESEELLFDKLVFQLQQHAAHIVKLKDKTTMFQLDDKELEVADVVLHKRSAHADTRVVRVMIRPYDID